MEVLAAESGRGKAVLGSTHDVDCVAEHFARMLALKRALVADGPAALIRHPGVLRSTYGGHRIAVGRGGLVLSGSCLGSTRSRLHAAGIAGLKFWWGDLRPW